MDLLEKMALLQQQQTVTFLMFLFVMVRGAQNSGEGKRAPTLFDKLIFAGFSIYCIVSFIKSR